VQLSTHYNLRLRAIGIGTIAGAPALTSVSCAAISSALSRLSDPPHQGGEAVLKPESFPIDKIYVPVKRRKALRPDVVRELAESILDIGQQEPILVRPDEDRFVLVEGLHRLEACKALGEAAIIGVVVSAEEAHQKTPSDPGLEAERQKMERLKKLRLEKEAAEKLASASRAPSAAAAGPQREQPKKTIRNDLKARSSQSGRGSSGSAPRTLSEWIKRQERDGGRY
jgi:ParB-like nuclease family protein